MALIQHKSSSSNVLTVSALGTGNTVIIFATLDLPSYTITGITDNATGGSNTYVQVPGAFIATGPWGAHDAWICVTTRPGATTITLATSGLTDQCAMMEVAGITSGTADKVAHIFSSSTANPFSLASVTTTNAADFLASWGQGKSGTTSKAAADTTFTQADVQSGGGVVSGSSYAIVSSTGTYTPKWNQTSTDEYAGITLAFPMGGGGSDVATGSGGQEEGASGTAGESIAATGSAGSAAGASGNAGEQIATTGSAGEQESATGNAGEQIAATGTAGESEGASGAAGEAIAATGGAGEAEGAIGNAGESIAATGTGAQEEGAQGTAGSSGGASNTGSAAQEEGAQGSAGEQIPATGAAGQQESAQGVAGESIAATGSGASAGGASGNAGEQIAVSGSGAEQESATGNAGERIAAVGTAGEAESASGIAGQTQPGAPTPIRVTRVYAGPAVRVTRVQAVPAVRVTRVSAFPTT